MCNQEFEEVLIVSETARKSFILLVRKDIRALLQELYDKLGEVRAPSRACLACLLTQHVSA